MSAATKTAKPVRDCTSCTRPLTADQITYSSPYPEFVLTRTGGKRKGALTDAERVWCSADCAQATWELAHLTEET